MKKNQLCHSSWDFVEGTIRPFPHDDIDIVVVVGGGEHVEFDEE